MPYHLDCAAIHVLLLPMIHGQLPQPLSNRIQSHLHQCPTCTIEYTELQGLQRQVNAVIDQLPTAPDSLWSKLQLATTPTPVPKAEPLDLLSSCLNLLNAVGIPAWATQPVTRSISLATEVRDELHAMRAVDLSHLGVAGND